MDDGLEHDPAAWAGGSVLDDVAEAVFDGIAGKVRLAPLIARFDAEVGGLRPTDEHLLRLQAIRMDWALCEVELSGPGDTWARRAADGVVEVEGGPTFEEDARMARETIGGLFEVWPGTQPWLRDRLSGGCFRLLDPTGPIVERALGPAALWEARLIFDQRADGVRLCRPPLEYPLELVEVLEGTHARRFERPRWPSLQHLRRARLHWSRSRGQRSFARSLGIVER